MTEGDTDSTQKRVRLAHPAHRDSESDEPLDVEATMARPVPKQVPGAYEPKIPDVSITGTIGTGGQGVVFSGYQEYLERPVAVKVLHRHVDPSFSKRFQREAKILAGLHHSNIVTCHQAGVTDDDHCYMVMEFIDGPDLYEWVRANGPLAGDDAVGLVLELCDALAHGLDAEVIHRDVKPQNVLLSELVREGRRQLHAKLADLGLARCSADDGKLPQLTTQGAVMGTPTTMAPEQFDSPDEVDHRADIYGLGCVLFFALTGRPAFEGSTITEIYRKKTEREVPRMIAREERVPAVLRPVLAKLMAPTASDRPQSYAEVRELLEGTLGERGESNAGGGAVRRVAVVVALMAVAALGAFLAMRDAGSEEGKGEPKQPKAERSESRPGANAQGEELDSDADGATETEENDGDDDLGLTTLAPGETRHPFDTYEDEASFLKDWTPNVRTAFFGFDADWSQPSGKLVRGVNEATATMQAFAGEWALTGTIQASGSFRAPDKFQVAVQLVDRDDKRLEVVALPRAGSQEDVLIARWVAGSDSAPTAALLTRHMERGGESALDSDRHGTFGFETTAEGVRVALMGGEWHDVPDSLGFKPREVRLCVTRGTGYWRNFEIRGL